MDKHQIKQLTANIKQFLIEEGEDNITDYECHQWAFIIAWFRGKDLTHSMCLICTKHPNPKKVIEDLCYRSFSGEDFACRIRELAETLE